MNTGENSFAPEAKYSVSMEIRIGRISKLKNDDKIKICEMFFFLF